VLLSFHLLRCCCCCCCCCDGTAASFAAAYIDILNLLQASALRRLRELESAGGSADGVPSGELQAVLDVVLVTLNGVSAGMRNTG
jgi:phosphoenolpyruvate carboxylase